MAYQFGSTSRERLRWVRPELVEILEMALQLVDLTVLNGRRGKAKQDEYRADGKSKVQWPDSAHNCPIVDPSTPKAEWAEDPNGLSRAVDVAPWHPQYPHIFWDDRATFCYLQGILQGIALMRGVKLRFGGDWDRDGYLNWRDTSGSSFNDLPHVELVD